MSRMRIEILTRISLILDRRVVFSSFHIGVSLVVAAVVWAIPEMVLCGSLIRDN